MFEQKTTENPWTVYNRNYRKRHPEKALQFRINAARNLLTKYGYGIIAPAEMREKRQNCGESEE